MPHTMKYVCVYNFIGEVKLATSLHSLIEKDLLGCPRKLVNG